MSEQLPKKVGLDWVDSTVVSSNFGTGLPRRKITSEQLKRMEVDAEEAVLRDGLSPEGIGRINRYLEDMEEAGLAHRAARLAGIINALNELTQINHEVDQDTGTVIPIDPSDHQTHEAA